METTFRLNISALDNKFLSMLKSLFQKREVEITITDVPADDTELLLGDTKNKKYLLKAINDVKNNRNLIRFSGEEFEKFSKSLLKK